MRGGHAHKTWRLPRQAEHAWLEASGGAAMCGGEWEARGLQLSAGEGDGSAPFSFAPGGENRGTSWGRVGL